MTGSLRNTAELRRGTPRFITTDINMSELARRVNLDVSTISRYFSGERIPNALIFMQMVDVLNVEPWQLAKALLPKAFKHDA